MYLLCSSILPCSSRIDARALCQAAGSLKELNLHVSQSCTSEAAAEVCDHRPLEKLLLFLNTDDEVSCAYSPDMYFCGADSEVPV